MIEIDQCCFGFIATIFIPTLKIFHLKNNIFCEVLVFWCLHYIVESRVSFEESYRFTEKNLLTYWWNSLENREPIYKFVIFPILWTSYFENSLNNMLFWRNIVENIPFSFFVSLTHHFHSLYSLLDSNGALK